MQQEKEERRISMLLIDKDFSRSEDIIDKHHFDQEVLDKKNELLNDQWWGAC